MADTESKNNKAKKTKFPRASLPINNLSAPKTKVFKITIHPLLLLTCVLLIIFVGVGLLNQTPTKQQVSVDEFIRGIKEHSYSRVSIQDNGEVLAQDKYVLTVEEVDSARKLEVPSSTQVAELQTVSLADLVTALKPLDPLTKLREALLNRQDTTVSEIYLGENFIVAAQASLSATYLLAEDVSASEFMTAVRDAGINAGELPLITNLRSAQEVVSVASMQSRLLTEQIATVFAIGNTVYARVKDAEINTYSIFWDGGIRSFANTLQTEGISLADENVQIGTIIVATIPWGDIISLLTLVGFLALGYFLFRGVQGSGNSLMRFGQSKARMFWGVKPDVTFKDVAGIDEAKEELSEVVQFLKNPEKFRKLGARIPKGVLMVGAPGTGKTLLARAIAGEAGVPFFHTSGSEFEEMLVGAGASRVRDLFDKAKKASPALIFIDEIDAVARKRGTTIQSSTTEQTLNQILVEMDGFEQNLNVIVIAATNRPDVLDPAILRPGRFDRRVVLDLPDIEGRTQILAIHAKNKPLAADVSLEKVAKRTVGFSGADLENVLNEAAIIAAKRDRKEIIFEDIEEAATKVVMGPAKNQKRTTEELNLVAVHEAGHAVVSHFMPQVDPVHRVSIISRGMSSGVTEFLPQDDNRIITRTKLLSRIAVLLGGRAAEHVVLGDISTGAANDIDHATQIVRNMVQKFGMSEKLGLIKYGESNELQYLGYGYGEQRDYSDDTAKLIDEEVRSVVREAYARALKVLEDNRTILDKLTDMLLEQEVVEAEEFEGLFKSK